MDPQTFLLRCLHVLWEDLKDETDVLLVLLDDVQNFDRVSEIFTLIKNVLSDKWSSGGSDVSWRR